LMASSIGIKIANGEFYSIMEENSTVKKRLILTTVHDSQRSVQIDLYKSFTKSMADALYIGSLVIENIRPKPKGEPSIEMIIASTVEGEITADAVDLDTSANAEHHHLSVSLTSLDEDNRDYEIPDFELDQHEPPPQGLYEQPSKKDVPRRGFPWLILIIIGIAIIVIGGILAWFFLFRGKPPADQMQGNPAPVQPAASVPVIEAPAAQAVPAQQEAAPAVQPPPVQREGAQPAQVPAAAQPPPVQREGVQSAQVPAAAQSPPAQQEAAAVAQVPAVAQPPPARPAAAPASDRRARSVPPVASYKVPAIIPQEGITYTIRWGDTLWDISEAFYRNPRLYIRIARVNNIRNPDRIISGSTIRILPR
jgi:LysM repeat protein